MIKKFEGITYDVHKGICCLKMVIKVASKWLEWTAYTLKELLAEESGGTW